MGTHPLLAFGALLAESSSMNGFINVLLLLFSAAGLPALLGLLALWLGRPRASWAPLALFLGMTTAVLAGFSIRIVFAVADDRPWSIGDWESLVLAGWPLLLGLGVCAWAWRCLRATLEQAPPRT